MPFLALPLRMKGAFVQRTDEAQAIIGILRVMANTPHGSWAGSRHFGMRDFFEQARVRPELPELAIQEANLTLQDLGITKFRIDTISKEAQTKRDIDSYQVTLTSAEGEKVAFALHE